MNGPWQFYPSQSLAVAYECLNLQRFHQTLYVGLRHFTMCYSQEILLYSVFFYFVLCLLPMKLEVLDHALLCPTNTYKMSLFRTLWTSLMPHLAVPFILLDSQILGDYGHRSRNLDVASPLSQLNKSKNFKLTNRSYLQISKSIDVSLDLVCCFTTGHDFYIFCIFVLFYWGPALFQYYVRPIGFRFKNFKTEC